MFTKLVRIGRDAELRHTANNKPVISLPVVYDVGWGESKRSQWIDLSIWGNQAESLWQYLKKGNQIVVTMDDLELETYQTKQGTNGSKIKARAINVNLTDSRTPAAPNQPQSQQNQPPQQQPQNNNGFNDNFDEDLPF